MIAKRLFILLVLLLGSTAARAGTISPGLEILLQDLGENDSIKVLVVLDHQADIAVLDRNLRGAKSAMPRRHRLVVESLRAAADASQADLLADLAARSNTGQVLGFVPHWLINSVVVTATPSAVREIAARPDVARVEPDLVVTLISPVPGIKNMSALAKPGGIGIASGVRAVGAPRVWRELGIDGTGRPGSCRPRYPHHGHPDRSGSRGHHRRGAGRAVDCRQYDHRGTGQAGQRGAGFPGIHDRS